MSYDTIQTDFEFKCPANACGSKLSFSEFFVKQCCGAARGGKTKAKRLRNSFSDEIHKLKQFKLEFDEALEIEDKIDKNIQNAEIALAKMKSKMKNATAERKQIQEKIRAALLTTVRGLRDQGHN